MPPPGDVRSCDCIERASDCPRSMVVTNTRSLPGRLAVSVIAAASMCAGGCSADDMALATLADVLTTVVVSVVSLIMDQVFAGFAV